MTFEVYASGFTTITTIGDHVRLDEQARRQAIASGQPQQQPSVEQMLEMQPIGAIRLHNMTKIVTKPASPLERQDHDVHYGEVEIHLLTFGDPDRQVIPLPLQVAEIVYGMLGDSINRAKAKIAGAQANEDYRPDEPEQTSEPDAE